MKIIALVILLQSCSINVTTVDIVTVNIKDSEIKPEILTKDILIDKPIKEGVQWKNQ